MMTRAVSDLLLRLATACAAFVLAAGGPATAQRTPAAAPAPSRAAALAAVDPLFADFFQTKRAPGVVYGVVADGRLIYVRSLGVQDTATRAPVTPDTVFRIASMTKNFTALAALKLRDEGRLDFQAPAETWLPELKRLRYPTSDSPRITVRDLISHSAGLVTDDPWGDRQMDMDEAAFDAFLATAVPMSRAPQTAHEYSNTGYALLGRVISRASGRPYIDYVTAEILRPLGMTSSSFRVADVPRSRRALGYRWQGGAWVREPELGHGPYVAMGGLQTTANDYARYLAFVLSAWPPRDGAESAVLKRASVRETALGATLPVLVRRPVAERADPEGCDTARVYGLGLRTLADCKLGFALTHGGGFPGYGSNVLMMPDRGLAVFAFSNGTYAPAGDTVRLAARSLVDSGAFPIIRPEPSPGLIAMRDAAAAIYARGDVAAAPGALAGNVLLDRDAAHRNAELSRLKTDLGACARPVSLTPQSLLEGEAVWACDRGRLRARLLLAPTAQPSLQSLEFSRAE
jgi:CubicO group peptidase (beta-lactamase class C family)